MSNPDVSLSTARSSINVSDAGTWASAISIPQTQNTAPVIEFRCLYTSDIRRKQKRWQDGRLKFHTFNKRIMVYDDRGNFVADTHWREDHALEEGEELEMDRCGMILQVCEFVGSREQDLTGLFSRAVNEKQRVARVVPVAFTPLQLPELRIQTRESILPRAEAEVPISVKRRKPNNCPSSSNPYAQSLTGANLNLFRTRSIAAPARYDPLLLSSPRPLARTNNLSRGDGRSVTSNTSKSKMNGQVKMAQKRISSARLTSTYAEKITGGVLMLASRTPENCDLPPMTRIAGETAPSLDRNGSALIISEEDEFIDIDVYDKKGLPSEKTLTSSLIASGPGEGGQGKYLPESLNNQLHSEDSQPERHSNPLRIRTRPKRKLFSAATPSSRPSSLTEISLRSKLSNATSSGSGFDLDSFKKTLSNVTPVTQNVPIINQTPRLSSPFDSGIDHHSIDIMLARKCPEEINMAKCQHEKLQALIRNIDPVQPAIEMEEPKSQENALFSHIPDLPPEEEQKVLEGMRESLASYGHTDNEVERGHTSPSILIRSSSLSAQPSNGTSTIATEDIKAVKPPNQSKRDLGVKRDIVPLKPLVNLTDPTNQSTAKACKDSRQRGHYKNGISCQVINMQSAVSFSKVNQAHKESVANNEEGPWTREAFDLFDWRPNAGTAGDDLVVGRPANDHTM